MAKRHYLIVLPLLVLAAALYAPHLPRLITYDEAYTLRHYAYSAPSALIAYTLPNNHFLNSFLIWAMTAVAGKSELAIRLPAFAAAMLALSSIYRLGRAYFDPRAALAALVLLMTSGPFTNYAVTARGYSFGILLTLCLLIVVLRRPHQRRLIIAICIGLMITLPSMIILIASVGLWALVKNRPLVFPLMVGTLSGAMFYLPALATGLFDAQPAGYYGDPNLLVLLSSWLQAIFLKPLLPGILFAVLTLVGVLSFRSVRPAIGFVLLSMFLMFPILSAAQLVVTGSLFYARNFLYLIGPLALIGGHGLYQIAGQRAGWVAALVIGLFVIAPPAVDADPQVPLLMNRLEHNLAPGETILIGDPLNEPVWYYLGVSHPEWFIPTPESRAVFILETSDQSLDNILNSYDLKISPSECRPADTEWEPFDVWKCR